MQEEARRRSQTSAVIGQIHPERTAQHAFELRDSAFAKEIKNLVGTEVLKPVRSGEVVRFNYAQCVRCRLRHIRIGILAKTANLWLKLAITYAADDSQCNG